MKLYGRMSNLWGALASKKNIILATISALLLASAWTISTGLLLLFALVPLLYISSQAEDSKRGWWSVFWYSIYTFLLWNILTVWWIWHATPVGPIAATILSTTLSMLAFMTFHTLSKKATKPLSYCVLVSLWITMEYWNTMGSISWPWLLLGNGFSGRIWAIQWYEYTGLFGGSLWVLLSNIAIFEAWKRGDKRWYVAAAVVVALPLLTSTLIYFTYNPNNEGSIKVTAVQPNVHFQRDERLSSMEQVANLTNLAQQAPHDVDYIIMPEATISDAQRMNNLEGGLIVRRMRALLQQDYPSAAAIVGVTALQFYSSPNQSQTARTQGNMHYDLFNSALYIPATEPIDYHHKAKLVIGTESTPFPWLFKALDFLVIDLGGVTGQMGVGSERRTFYSEQSGVTIGTAICYEALYGAYFGEFIKNGAEAMFVISNDCWWEDTPGYKHLFAMSALRAVEHRRAIARSANTGISGFINSRGDTIEQLGWDIKGVVTQDVSLHSKVTIYTRFGDYIARLSLFMAALSLLAFWVSRYKKKA